MEGDVKGFVMYKNWRRQIEMLSNEESGILLKNLFRFVDGEELIEMDDLTKLLFSIMQDTISRDVVKWESRREKNILNGRRGGRPRKNTEDSTETEKPEEKPKTKRFVPPSIEELKSYIEEENLNVNPERFHDFYSSKNWYIGRNKMANWKCAVRNWDRKESEGNNGKTGTGTDESFDRSQYQ